jgi:hypothetical protein
MTKYDGKYRKLGTSRVNGWNVSVPEFHSENGVFRDLNAEAAETMLAALINDPDAEAFLDSLNESKDYFLGVIHAILHRSGSSVQLCFPTLVRSIAYRAKISTKFDKFRGHADGVVAGILAVGQEDSCDVDGYPTVLNRKAGCFAQADRCFLSHDGDPWFVICFKQVDAWIESECHGGRPLKWGDILSANIQDLHNINLHPMIVLSMTLSQCGFKLRFRIPSGNENEYKCYQFPGGDEFCPFDSFGKEMFLRIIARAVHREKNIPLIEPGRKRATAPHHEAILVNDLTGMQVKFLSYRGLPEGIILGLVDQELEIGRDIRMRLSY